MQRLGPLVGRHRGHPDGSRSPGRNGVGPPDPVDRGIRIRRTGVALVERLPGQDRPVRLIHLMGGRIRPVLFPLPRPHLVGPQGGCG
ncbi:hypothetical protein [Streptomyces sp. NPDC005476]|uniref:hypothetical protein n=1 Tax=Streptomyces sp. NPDC005476 TaxID=3156882 RepID=UPI0034528CD0